MRAYDGIVWWNGRFEPLESVRISPLDRGLQYGDGLFETLRVQQGRALFLKEHLNRLEKSLGELRFNTDLTQFRTLLDPSRASEVIGSLIEQNGLAGEICRLKILVTRGVVDGLGLPEPVEPTVLMMVFPYRPPDRTEYERGWNAVILRTFFTPFHACHKTLNYLVFLMAREEARRAGAQEALLADRDGNVAEGSTTGVIFYKDGLWVEPESPCKLPSITVAKVIEILRELGERVTTVKLSVEDVRRCDTVWVMNSMIGVMPLRSVDGQRLPRLRADLAESIRKKLFS